MPCHRYEFQTSRPAPADVIGRWKRLKYEHVVKYADLGAANRQSGEGHGTCFMVAPVRRMVHGFVQINQAQGVP